MSITITSEQRDVLYDHILLRLTGIDDVYIATERGDLDVAERLGSEFIDYLLLLRDDLGWQEHCEEPVQLTSSPEVLQRVLSRLKQRAEGEDQQEADLRAEVWERQERNRLMRETCEQLLAELAGASRS